MMAVMAVMAVMAGMVVMVVTVVMVAPAQELLQLQYEGVAVMKMFDRAKVNVNLLLFLLNKKFFKK